MNFTPLRVDSTRLIVDFTRLGLVLYASVSVFHASENECYVFESGVKSSGIGFYTSGFYTSERGLCTRLMGEFHTSESECCASDSEFTHLIVSFTCLE